MKMLALVHISLTVNKLFSSVFFTIESFNKTMPSELEIYAHKLAKGEWFYVCDPKNSLGKQTAGSKHLVITCKCCLASGKKPYIITCTSKYLLDSGLKT